MYEFEYIDGHKASLNAKAMAQNMFTRVDNEENIHVLFYKIIDHCCTAIALKKAGTFIVASSGNRQRQETTKEWDMLFQWNDGSTTLIPLKDIKESYPVQVSEYATLTQIQEEPSFAWWVPHVMQKRNRIVAKVKIQVLDSHTQIWPESA